jgi:hypothetical protein
MLPVVCCMLHVVCSRDVLVTHRRRRPHGSHAAEPTAERAETARLDPCGAAAQVRCCACRVPPVACCIACCVLCTVCRLWFVHMPSCCARAFLTVTSAPRLSHICAGTRRHLDSPRVMLQAVSSAPTWIRRYIAYARKYVRPVLSDEAKRVLQTFYLELRKRCALGSSRHGVLRCSVSCCVATCRAALQRVVLRCNVSCCVATCRAALHRVVLRCNVSCYVATWCAALQRVVLRCIAA